MIERPRLFWIRQNIRTAFMMDLDKALFNIDIGCAIFAHGTQFHQMTVRRKFLHGVQDVKRANDIVCLCENSVPTVNHRVRGGTLFGKVDYSLRLKRLKDCGNCLIVHCIANIELDLSSGNFFPRLDAFMKGGDGNQTIEAAFKIEVPAHKVVEDSDIMSFTGKVE